jgi:hypothetical protein
MNNAVHASSRVITMFKVPLAQLEPGLRSLRWTSHIVKLSSSGIVCRGTHSSAIKQHKRHVTKPTLRRQVHGKKEPEPPMTRFTIQVRSPNSTVSSLTHHNIALLKILKSVQDILNKISKECLPRVASPADGSKYKGNYGVVILATPSFAAWLEDNAGFIPKVLKSMDLFSSVSVISACVDGLPEGE